MKYKITEIYNKENGHLCGYSIAYKPFPIIPYWIEIEGANGPYKTRDEAEHDLIFLATVHGKVKNGRRYL